MLSFIVDYKIVNERLYKIAYLLGFVNPVKSCHRQNRPDFASGRNFTGSTRYNYVKLATKTSRLYIGTFLSFLKIIFLNFSKLARQHLLPFVYIFLLYRLFSNNFLHLVSPLEPGHCYYFFLSFLV